MIRQLRRHAGGLEVVVHGVCSGCKYFFDEDLGWGFVGLFCFFFRVPILKCLQLLC